jgi:hypothetical protein
VAAGFFIAPLAKNDGQVMDKNAFAAAVWQKGFSEWIDN